MANNPTNPRSPGGRFDATSTTEQARDVGGSVMQTAKDLGERAQDAMTSLKEKAGDVASDVGHRVTDTWEAGRDYVSEQGLGGIAEDITALIRRNPIPSLLIGFGLGFMLGRAIRD